MRLAAVLLALVPLVAGCKKPEPSFDERLAANLERIEMKIPAASGPTTTLPDDSLMIFVSRDAISWETAKSFGASKNGFTVWLASFDPARAATEGAPAKVRRSPADPIIFPFADVVAEYGGRREAATILCSTDPPPAELMRQIRATLTHYKVPNHYRLVRKSDGSIANEPLPAL